jgi:hypothetical protein
MVTDLKLAVLSLAAGLQPSPKPTKAVCPKAPPGMQPFADQVTGWVKWGVLALIVIAALVSIGSILVGRIFNHPHGARFGAMGIAATVMCAFLYVSVGVILGSITGTGC